MTRAYDLRLLAVRLARSLLCAALACLLLASAVDGAESPRDPFFPHSGNSGYDVLHYDIRLAYQPGRGWLEATTRIEARAKQGLRRFSLDLVGLRVTRVTVDGERARATRGPGKLRVTPPIRLAKGEEFGLTVHYRGKPRTVVDPDGAEEGWMRTADGAIAVGEPVGTAAWLPCNNTLTDKASFDLRLTVPAGLKGVANGRLAGVSRAGGRTTFEWRAAEPMAPYLAVIDIGRGRLRRDSAAGVPTWTLVEPGMWESSRRVLAELPEAIRFLSRAFGPYPFDAAGSIVDRADLGYALETQTRPIYAYVPDVTTLVHETAHQWFGDSVGLKRWPNIWLNEGFATWSQWWYAEHHGGRTARQIFRRLYRVPASNTDFWEPPPGRPGKAANLFDSTIYVRGAMAVEAFRIEVGTRTMLKTLRRWTSQHRYGNADIGQFVELAEEVSDRSLDGLFQRWLYQRGKPSL